MPTFTSPPNMQQFQSLVWDLVRRIPRGMTRLPRMARTIALIAQAARRAEVVYANGLFIETMLEPPPPPGFLALAPEYEEAASIPRLLFLRCTKRAAPAAPETYAAVR
mgnify:CR=1 FL=1